MLQVDVDARTIFYCSRMGTAQPNLDRDSVWAALELLKICESKTKLAASTHQKVESPVGRRERGG